MTKKLILIGIIAIIFGAFSIPKVIADLTPNLRIDPTSAYKLRIATPNPHSWDNGLVGYWTMNGQDISGTTLTDKSSEGNNGTIYGAVGKAGIIGQALSFDGVNDYVGISHSESQLISDAITFEAWVNLSELASSIGGDGTQLLEKASDRWVWRQEVNDKFYVDLKIDSVGQRYTWNTAITETGVWHHLVFTFDGTTGRKYLNGSPDGTNSTPGSIGTSTGSLYIGTHRYIMNYFPGLIDEMRIYNRALSAEEIKEHYNLSKRNLRI